MKLSGAEKRKQHHRQRAAILATSDLTQDQRIVMVAVAQFNEKGHAEAKYWDDLATATGMKLREVSAVVKGLVDSKRLEFWGNMAQTVTVIDPPLFPTG